MRKGKVLIRHTRSRIQVQFLAATLAMLPICSRKHVPVVWRTIQPGGVRALSPAGVLMNTFPIYQIKIRFDRDIASHHKMFRNHPTQQEMNEAVDKAIANTLDSHPDYKVESISVKYLGEETWCRTWFSHYTYNTGTDKEILDSFRDYVYRALRGKVPWIENRDQLMGADEEWRWKGHKILDDGSVVLVDPPCHCKYCRENGWIFIVH